MTQLELSPDSILKLHSYYRVHLTSALKKFFNGLFKEDFDTTFTKKINK